LKTSGYSELNTSFVILQNDLWLNNLRIAGKNLSAIMNRLEDLVKEKTSLSMIEIDKLVEEEILKHEGCYPTFKNYKSFPASVCISINNQLVHGIPTDYKLQDGDLVSFDFGITYKGAIADCARTFIFGEPKQKLHQELVDTTRECLGLAIKSIQVGKKTGVIGNAIYKHAKNKGFAVITQYGGHGISMQTTGEGIPHAQPFISNRTTPDDGVRIQPGLTIAIEPLLCIGDAKPVVGSDKWTVSTPGLSAHFEDTIFIHKDKVEVITL
jgi:methionyl aminopeptidase